MGTSRAQRSPQNGTFTFTTNPRTCVMPLHTYMILIVYCKDLQLLENMNTIMASKYATMCQSGQHAKEALGDLQQKCMLRIGGT